MDQKNWQKCFLVQSIFTHTEDGHLVAALNSSAGDAPVLLYLEKEAALALAAAVQVGQGQIKNATITRCSVNRDVAIIIPEGGSTTTCVVPAALLVGLMTALRTTAGELD
jgi:hypothetical protein